MSYVEDRPAGFQTAQVDQDAIPMVTDSELANKIEKTRNDILKYLGKRKRIEIRDERPRPDPQNIECPICSLSSARRVVMTRVDASELPDSGQDLDFEGDWNVSEVYYHCEVCNMRVYREDPAFADYAETSPHDALTVVAVNDPNADDNKPIMVSQTSAYQKRKRKQERQHSLDKIMEKLDYE